MYSRTAAHIRIYRSAKQKLKTLYLQDPISVDIPLDVAHIHFPLEATCCNDPTVQFEKRGLFPVSQMQIFIDATSTLNNLQW